MISRHHLLLTCCQHCHFQSRVHSCYLLGASMATQEADRLANRSKNAKCVHPSHRYYQLFFPRFNRVDVSGRPRMIITIGEAGFGAGDDLENRHPRLVSRNLKRLVIERWRGRYPLQSIFTVAFAAFGFIIATIFAIESPCLQSYS